MPPADRAPEEPSAGMRQVARLLRDQYVALLAEGFTEGQSLALLGATLAALMNNARGN